MKKSKILKELKRALEHSSFTEVVFYEPEARVFAKYEILTRRIKSIIKQMEGKEEIKKDLFEA